MSIGWHDSFDNVVGDVREQGPFDDTDTLYDLEWQFNVPMPVEDLDPDDLDDLQDYYSSQKELLDAKDDFISDLEQRYEQFKAWRESVEEALQDLDNALQGQIKLATDEIDALIAFAKKEGLPK